MKKFFIVLGMSILVLAIAAPAMADFTAYGSARMFTFMRDQSKEWTGTGYSDDDLQWELANGTSRFGIKFKKDDLSARVEIRPKNGSYYRHWWGAYKFGAGKVIVGQTYTAVGDGQGTSDQCCDDEGLAGWGGLPVYRDPQIRLDIGGLKLSLVEPNAGSGYGTYTTETDVSIPKIEASYKFNLGPATITPIFGMNSYDAVNATDQSIGIDSMIYGLYVRAAFGPFIVQANYYKGTNMDEYGEDAEVDESPVVTGSTVEDTDTTGMTLVLSYIINENMEIQAGYGTVESENAKWVQKDDASSYYVQLDYQLAKGFHIIPEFGKFDKGEDGSKVKEGDESYFGAKWQINF